MLFPLSVALQNIDQISCYIYPVPPTHFLFIIDRYKIWYSDTEIFYFQLKFGHAYQHVSHTYFNPVYKMIATVIVRDRHLPRGVICCELGVCPAQLEGRWISPTLVGLRLHCRWSLGGGSCRDSGVGNNYEQQPGSRCSTLAPGPSSVTATALWQLYQQFTTWPAGSLFLCGYKWLSSNPGPISLSTFGVWLQLLNLQLMRLLWGERNT